MNSTNEQLLDTLLTFTKMRIWGIHKRYKDLGWFENFMSGSVSLFNHRIVFFGENAMHWAVNIRTKWGYVCFRLPFRCFGKWWSLYFYISPDGTPNEATFYLGKNRWL